MHCHKKNWSDGGGDEWKCPNPDPYNRLWGGKFPTWDGLYHRGGQEINSSSHGIVWRPVSILVGALNFAYACSPSIVKGNNFFRAVGPQHWKKFVSGKAITLNMEKNYVFWRSSIIGEMDFVHGAGPSNSVRFLALKGHNDLGNKFVIQCYIFWHAPKQVLSTMHIGHVLD